MYHEIIIRPVKTDLDQVNLLVFFIICFLLVNYLADKLQSRSNAFDFRQTFVLLKSLSQLKILEIENFEQSLSIDQAPKFGRCK